MGPPVNDYSARVWSGLIRDFYVPRMRAVLEAMQGDSEDFDRESWEAEWVQQIGISSVNPYATPALAAQEVVAAAYANEIPETVN